MQHLDDLWTREEIHWHQRSRVRWLQAGDKNTKFFHLSTVQRRKRNKVRLIKNGDRVWLDGDVHVAESFGDYFKELFTSDGPRNWEAALDSVDCRVSEEMNDNLLLPITLEEVKTAVFDLGALKSPGPDGFQGTFYQSY